nr:hypothetical protein [Streptomyces sp. 846.5]
MRRSLLQPADVGLPDFGERRSVPGLRRDELAHATRRGSKRRSPAPEHADEANRHLLAAFGDAPAVVLGRHSDVLAWNRTGHALFAGHLDPHIPEELQGLSAPVSGQAVSAVRRVVAIRSMASFPAGAGPVWVK